ncbi:MAG: acyltransferase [Actinomycetota bacterium]|nr:acyltransferase [Actinomycetota bacterium]
MRHAGGRRQVSWDLLRSGFVLLVVIYHATHVAPVVHPELAPRPFSFPHQVGASLLLVVSAYFTSATVGRQPSGRYWWGRVARLVPAFLAAVVVTWATVRYLAPTDWYTPGKRELVGNLLLLGHWKPQEFPFLDGSYWTLPLQLMGFTVAALLWRSRWGHGRALRAVLWTAVLLPLILWPVRAGGPPEPYRMVVDGFGFHRVHLFIAGVAIWLWANGRLTRTHFLALITTCLLGQVVHTLVPGPDGWSEDWNATIGVFCGIAVICLAARVPDWDRWIPGPLRMTVRWIAGISYGLYLIHQTVGYVLMRHLQDLGAGPLEQSAAMLAAGVLLGWLLTGVDEQPAHRALMSFYDHRVQHFWASHRPQWLSPIHKSPSWHRTRPNSTGNGVDGRP